MSNDSFNYEKHSYSFVDIQKNDLSHGAYIHLHRILSLLEHASPNSQILDYGCGAGALLRGVQKENSLLNLHGVDISKIALQEAQQASANILYSRLSSEKTTYPDNFFDYIYMCEVLEHVPEPDKTLSEIRRVLKPNGQFLLAVPQEKSLLTLQGILYKLFKFTPSRQTAGHIQFWNQIELEQLLKKHNFKIKNIYYSQHYLWQLTGMAYMLLLLLTKNQTQELSKQLAANKSTLATLANKSMQFLILLTNLESIIMQKFSHGLDIQFVCQKNQGDE